MKEQTQVPLEDPLTKWRRNAYLEKAKRELSRRHLMPFIKYNFSDYQENWHHTLIANALEAIERGELKRLAIFLPPRHGKQIENNYPVLSSAGWTTHGKLKPGDFVFSPSGKPIKVIAESSEIQSNVEIEFTNGEKIQCHENHEWVVYDRAYKQWKTYETKYFLKQTKFKKQKQVWSSNRAIYQLPFYKAIEFPEKKLLMHPYVLGAWLGNGIATAPCITGNAHDKPIVDKIAKYYAISSKNIHTITGCITTRFGSGSTRASEFGNALRVLLVFGNKHIPDIYKFSSIEQRCELLAGLIDTDGHVDKNGRVRIVTVSKKMAEDIVDVVNSLGWNGYCMSQKPTLSTSGIMGKKIVYSVGFNPDRALPVMLERKKIKKFSIRRKIGIASIQRIENGSWGKCIQVDSIDGLYLIGKKFIPTHNSELSTIQFPSWYLGRNPKKQIISVSYSADLAKEFGRKVRTVIRTQEYLNVFPETILSMESKSADKWYTKKGGSYTATGIGGSITGKGAHCFPSGTMIETERGELPIENLRNGERVLSFSHERNCPEFKPILANQSRIKRKFAKITTTSGRTLTATVDHPVFIDGKGYVEIQNLKIGEMLWVHQGGETGRTPVYAMPERIQTSVVRIYQASSSWTRRYVLFSRLFSKTSFVQVPTKVHQMRNADTSKNNEVLFSSLSAFVLPKTARYSMRSMRENHSSTFSGNEVLLNELQKRFSLSCHDGKFKSELSTWFRFKNVPQKILQDSSISPQKRRKELCYLQNRVQSCYPPSRQKSKEQRLGKFGDGLHDSPRHTSQVFPDAVSSVEFFEKRLKTYDIQISENENFFANGILVHNCLIIDDPVKSRKEADSALIREQTYQWYRGTAYTRLAPDGAVILILTRWHDDDLAGRIINSSQFKASQWHVISLPAIATADEAYRGYGRIFMRQKGMPLWPEKYSLEKLQEIKNAIGPYEWSSQYQQNPVNDEMVEFHREWFGERTEEEVAKLNTLRYLTVDTAGRMTDSSNYIGMVDNRVDMEGNWNITGRKHKMDPAFFADYLFVLQQKYHYELIGIEKTIYLEGLEPYITKKEMETGITLPIKELKHGGRSKELRIRGLIPFYKSGKIFHIANQCEDLIPQLLRFPKSADDDIIDALAYQTQIAQAPFGWSSSDFPDKDPEKQKEREARDRMGIGSFNKHSPIGELDI